MSPESVPRAFKIGSSINSEKRVHSKLSAVGSKVIGSFLA